MGILKMDPNDVVIGTIFQIWFYECVSLVFSVIIYFKELLLANIKTRIFSMSFNKKS